MPGTSPGPGPWGLGATVLWTILLAAAMLVSGVLGGIIYLAAKAAAGQPPGRDLMTISSNGDYVSITLVIQMALIFSVLFLALALRSPYPFREYLALRPVRFRALVFWAAVLLLYNTAGEFLLTALDAEVSPWMAQVYGSAEHLGLLWLTVILAAPLTEETVFRAFVFKGIEARLGPAAAIAATAALWSALHLQYVEWYYLAIVAGLGVIFGLARYTSGSILAPLALHALNNLAASIQMQWF